MTPRVRRIAFVAFAAALFIGTHIPNLQVSVPNMDRPDLIIHLLAFGGWFTLLLASELIGPWRKTRSIGLCAVIAAAYACIDEFSQSLPGLNRTAAFDDLAANISGVLLAAIAALVLARLWKPSVPASPSFVPPPTSATDPTRR